MKLGRAVISGAYVGPERRASTSAERQRFISENPEAVAAGRSQHWLGWLPRPVLVGLLLAALVMASLLVHMQFTAHEAWVEGVNSKLKSVSDGDARLTRVETLAAEAQTKATRVEFKLQDLSEDTLLGFLWLAEDRQDTKAAQRFLQRLRELRQERKTITGER